MKNPEQWHPTKFEFRSGMWRSSKNPRHVSPKSRFICNILASVYEHNLKEHATGILLDLGCGHCPLYGIYRDYVDKIVCADWGNTLHPCPHLDHEIDLNTKIPLADAQFDTILLSDVIEHVANIETLWSEITRLLRPGGKIILGVPFMYWLHETPYDYYRYTEFALRRFCINNNLNILKIEPYGGSVEVTLDLVGKQMPNWPPLISLYNSLFIPLLRQTFGQLVPTTISKSFPLGYFLVAEKPK